MSRSLATPSKAKLPVWSSAALCCPLLLSGVVYFLSTAQGQAFNERVFGRYYTLGAILMLGSYSVLVFGLLALGVVAAVAGGRRGETPRWMSRLALAINVGIPFVILGYRSYF